MDRQDAPLLSGKGSLVVLCRRFQGWANLSGMGAELRREHAQREEEKPASVHLIDWMSGPARLAFGAGEKRPFLQTTFSSQSSKSGFLCHTRNPGVLMGAR